MNREELIKKWLDNNLSSEEQKAFEEIEDYNDIIQIDSALKSFKAPEFPTDKNYDSLKSRLKFNQNKSKQWYKSLLKIAAVLAICFSAYYYTTTLDTKINTQIAQNANVSLPDASTVHLNAKTTVIFNKKNWNDTREVKLDGEAFFKVAKGQKFDVITTNGTVTVLGTQFNVKHRRDYFEVTCFEGLVAVKHDEEKAELSPGNTLKIIDGKEFTIEKELTTQPSWLRGESSFTSTPLKYVISELERQYDMTFIAENIDTSRLFTGSFTHKNLDLALKSVTIPLNLNYIQSGNSIVLKRE
ncbi:FecR family protein [Winogradskyella flava]|uniref:FecR family protein n=1 Tax=Winogradskyella flava TaxID=1884876 RepID=UPI0024911E4B|nr:FecR domain-containing protein [Winogradskyella flava]